MKKICIIATIVFISGCGVELRLIPDSQAETSVRDVGQGIGQGVTTLGTITGNPLLVGGGMLLSTIFGGAATAKLKDKSVEKADRDYDEGYERGLTIAKAQQ